METDIKKIDQIQKHANGKGLFISADTNARSTMWFDIVTNPTNPRGKKLQDYPTTCGLFIVNIDSAISTFESTRGSSRIDLTITNGTSLCSVEERKSGEQESCTK